MMLSARCRSGAELLSRSGRAATRRELLGTAPGGFVSRPSIGGGASSSSLVPPPPPGVAPTTAAPVFGAAVRWYTPMAAEEEEQEKARVSHLDPGEKDAELRQLNRQIARLEMQRGINTGELYTWSGRYKALMRDYGFPLFVWYWCCWVSMGCAVYGAIDFGGLDAMAMVSKADAALSRLSGSDSWHLAERIDPQLGKIGVALVLNELLEPVRLPLVVVTLKPAMDAVNPPKY